MFLLVEYTDENELAVIPDTWLDGNSCALWPPYKSSSRVMNAVRQEEHPGANWKSFPIRELYRSEIYEKARKKLAVAENKSDLETGPENEENEIQRPKRVRRSPDHYSSDSDNGTVIPINRQKKGATCTTMPVPPPGLDLSGIRTTTPTTSTPTIRTAPISTPIRSENMHARDVRFFTLLEQILEKQKEQQIMLGQILHRLNTSGPAEEFAPGLPEDIILPITSKEDLEELEDKLQDAAVAGAMVNHLSTFGGRTLKESISRLLRELITNHLADLYNWSGAKGKLPLGNTKMVSIVFKCVQKNPITRGCTKQEMERCVKDWLRGARDRDGGRKRRSVEVQPPED
ncbi:hypothetical protein ScPMuIL_009461 [Solemya velum]